MPESPYLALKIRLDDVLIGLARFADEYRRFGHRVRHILWTRMIG